MADKKEKRISKVREMKNNLILDAAMKMFSDKGYHETRLEDIAAEAGFSKASLYNYYKDKEAIFFHLAVREYAMLLERLEHDPLYALDESLSFAENMRNFLHITFSTFGKHFGFLMQMDEVQFMKTISNHECPIGNCEEPTIEERFRKGHSKIDETVYSIIKKAIEKEEIQSTLSVEAMGNAIGGMVMGTMKRWRLAKKVDNIEQIIDEIVEVMQFGFRVKK